jgi:ADP-ribosyl-[dinitrogen reductase] hydrolase
MLIQGYGEIHDHAPEAPRLGAVLGLAVGDALGTTYEFERIDQPAYPTLATRPATDIVGAGPFNLTAGQVTDDTQMAICLARSLMERPGAAMPGIDLADLGSRYVAWYQHAFDVGNQTGSALRCIEQGEEPLRAGRSVWHASGRRAAGNGSLMRTAPIGVWHAADLATLIDTALADSLVTHADPRCALACAAFDAAIAAGIACTGERPADPRAAGAPHLAAARAALPVAAERLRAQWHDDRDDLAAIASAEQDLARDLDAATADEPGVYGDELDLHRTAGFVRVALRLACWHLVHTPWREAVIDTASRGGDADTNTAIVGALLGARDGVTAIPARWIDRVLGATQPGPPDWADAHHPRHLLALAGAR